MATGRPHVRPVRRPADAGAIGRLRPLGGQDVVGDRRLLGRADAHEPRADDAARLRASSVEAGNLENFRLAAGTATGRYRALGIMFDGPFPFLDSDVYKWLEASAGSSAGGRTTASPRMADEAIDARGGGPAAGRLPQHLRPGPRAGRRECRDLQFGHELYCVGHLIQAAVAWHRALGDDRLLASPSARPTPSTRALGPGGARRRSTAIPRSRWRSSSCTG